MGDPRKHRKKYTTPSHPWVKERLDSENKLIKSYGLKNKKEIYKMDSFLKNIKSLIKQLLSSASKQGNKEKEQLISKLIKLNLIKDAAHIDTILGLDLKNVLDRRLQSIVFKKGLANTIKQARQFIVHEHIIVGNKKITSPSYLVTAEKETQVAFSTDSDLSNEEHPERVVKTKDIKKEILKTKTKRTIDNDLNVPEIDSKKDKKIIIKDEKIIETKKDINIKEDNKEMIKDK